MNGNEKIVIGIGAAIGTVVIVLFMIAGFFSSNEESKTEETDAPVEVIVNSDSSEASEQKTEEELLAEILGEETPGAGTDETTSSESEPLEIIDRPDVNNDYIEWQQTTEYERELKLVNQKFLDVYYGNLEPKARNEQLKPLMIETVYEELFLPESGQVYQPYIESLTVETFVKEVNQLQGSLLNLLTVDIDNVPQKILLTVSFVKEENWLIDEIKLEVVHIDAENE